MSMNSRQRARLASLRDAPAFASRNNESDNALDFLKAIVERVENGVMLIRDLSVEQQMEPAFQTFTSMNGVRQRVRGPGGQSMSIRLSIEDAGQSSPLSPDDFSPSLGDPDSAPRFEDMTEDDVVERMYPAAPGGNDMPNEPKRAKRVVPRKAPVPAGASAPREIIFDDDGGDPT